MKTLKLLSFAFIAIAFLVSCEKKTSDEFDISTKDLKDATKMIITENLSSLPLSAEGVIPYLIPGANNGGNRTCEEVAVAFDTEFAMCGDKIDYEEGSFMGSFPFGLTVETDGTLVSFSMDNCIEIDGLFYKVGAVIVKGSDQANVYWYPEGTMGDSELAAPINASEGPAGLSNLSFCFVECDDPSQERIIGLKCWYNFAQDEVAFRSYAVSSGEIYPFESDWCRVLGFSTYEIGAVISLGAVGQATVNDDMTVTIVANVGYTFTSMHLFVGTLEELIVSVPDGDCPSYWASPWIVDRTVSNTVTIDPNI